MVHGQDDPKSRGSSGAKDAHEGDAYVLLANALAAGEVRSANTAADEYLLTRAAAVIQHWAVVKPRTRNHRAGQQMLESISDHICRTKGPIAAELQTLLESYRAAFLDDVIRPESFRTVQKVLSSCDDHADSGAGRP